MENGIRKIQQYGVIRLVADKTEYRVRADTIERLKALPRDFKGTLTINELGITVSPNQICFMEVRNEKVLHQKDFMRLPTEVVFFDKGGNMFERTMYERKIQRIGFPYYCAHCHYREEANGERSYYTKKEEMPLLMLMTPVPKEPTYPFQISGIWRYGEPQQW